MSHKLTRPSPALVIAVIALFAALAGSSYAQPIRAHVSALIGGKSIKKRAIGAKHVKRNVLTGLHIREGRLGKVPSAANADTVDGRDSLEFADGRVSLLAGRTTGEGGAGTIRTFETPAGSFELSCGAANADARYRNVTDADKEVYRTVLDDGASVGHDFYDAPPGGHIGYAATAVIGPAFVELSAATGETHARFRVHTRREGSTCTWSWELLVSR